MSGDGVAMTFPRQGRHCVGVRSAPGGSREQHDRIAAVDPFFLQPFLLMAHLELITKPHGAAQGVPGERGEERESKRSGYYARRRLRLCEPEASRSGALRRDSWR